MNRLKFEYVVASILLYWVYALVGVMCILPIVLAIVLSILYGPICLFILFGLLLSIPLCVSIFLCILDGHSELKEEYKFQSKLQKIEAEIEADRRRNPRAYEGYTGEDY